MKPEEMLKYAKEYDISERELNWLKSPYQRIEHVTKFEFPEVYRRRLTIEKSPFVNEGDKIWLLKDFHGLYIYNYYEGKFIGRGLITDKTSHNYHRNLKHAFDFAKRILKQAVEDHIKEIEMYNAGICWRCGKQVGKENLNEAWEHYFCPKCFDIVTD